MYNRDARLYLVTLLILLQFTERLGSQIPTLLFIQWILPSLPQEYSDVCMYFMQASWAAIQITAFNSQQQIH